jgi:hypothetical protein
MCGLAKLPRSQGATAHADKLEEMASSANKIKDVVFIASY